MNGAVVVHGVDPADTLAVVPADALLIVDTQNLVPTAGTWQRDGSGGRFTPRFEPMPGTEYVVLARADTAAAWVEVARVGVAGAPRAEVARGAVPRASAARTVVESIDPGASVVPANLLRFAVTFSAAMHEGDAGRRMHLRDESGADLPGALLEMPPELWDRTHRRLTLLLEPGRIKRGLQPNVQAGPPLVEGSRVTLVVDPELQDARGEHLAAGAQRVFTVGPAVRSRVDPARWSVSWPGGARGDSTVTVRFDRPLDRSLLRRCLQVCDSGGHPLPGAIAINADATQWRFTAGHGRAIATSPTSAESPGGWRVHVDTRLEDLCGNSVRHVFDRDLDNPADDGIAATQVVLTPDGLAPA